jgi:trigger factor
MTEEQQKPAVSNTVSIADAGPCRKKVEVEIPEESIKKATDDQYQTLQRDAIVPGFRKGRAPRRLLEKRFGKDTTEQIKLKLIADASEAALKDQKINYLREPDIDYKKVELPAAGPMKFEFEVEVRPEFDLPPLEGIEITKTRTQITDADIDSEIEQLQKWAGLWTPKEGKVENDDQLIADIVIKTEDDQQEEKIENSQIFVRENGFAGPVLVKDLDKLLIGAKTGDTKETTVDIPKTYYVEKYRGKKVNVKIAIKDIKWLKPAELGVELFKRLQVSNESELRQRMQDSLDRKLEQKSRQEMNGQLYKYLLEKTSFDLPLDIVAEQSNAVLQRQYVNLLRMGLAKEQIAERLDELKAASDQQAKEELKIFFIINKIAEKLGIETTQEEINGYIAQIATSRGQRPEHLRQTMERDGSLAQLTLQIREDKCLAKLLESAKITEVEQKPVSEKKPDKETKKGEAKPPKKEVKAAASKKPAAKTTPQKTDKKGTKVRAATKKKAGK